VSNFEGGAESSRRKGLWDPNLDVSAHIEGALLLPEDEERLRAHNGRHLLEEAIKQFGQALATSCLAVEKIQSQGIATESKIQENDELHRKVAGVQQELSHLQALYQRTEQLVAEKTKATKEQEVVEMNHRKKL